MDPKRPAVVEFLEKYFHRMYRGETSQVREELGIPDDGSVADDSIPGCTAEMQSLLAKKAMLEKQIHLLEEALDYFHAKKAPGYFDLCRKRGYKLSDLKTMYDQFHCTLDVVEEQISALVKKEARDADDVGNCNEADRQENDDE